VIHLTLSQISAYVDSELPGVSIELVRLHLSSCLECAERFGFMEEQEEALGRLLFHDPGDPFFARFSDQVVGAPKKAARRDPLPEARSPQPRKPEGASPRAAPVASPKRPGPARFLAPAAALIAVATGVGVVATHPQLVRFGRGGVGDQSVAAPADLLDRAAARSADAQRARTPEAYDAAAEAWQAAIPLLQNDPEELAAGHREIAAARFAAWNAGPTRPRHDAAMMAVRAYLLCAPPGEDRERAWAWLARLKR
jgi:putative zinc finger protein